MAATFLCLGGENDVPGHCAGLQHAARTVLSGTGLQKTPVAVQEVSWFGVAGGGGHVLKLFQGGKSPLLFFFCDTL